MRGYPTVIFTDPKGEVVASLSDRSPAGVKKQIEDLAKRYKSKSDSDEEELKPVALPFLDSLDKGLEQGKKDGKLVLAYFGDVSKEAITTAKSLIDASNKQLLGKFVGVQHAIAKDCEVCKKYKVRKGSLVLILDPADPEKPLSFIQGSRNAKSLAKSLQKVLKKWEDK